jgi:cobalt-zinc-cadmium efflux system membrane fusion protein
MRISATSRARLACAVALTATLAGCTKKDAAPASDAKDMAGMKMNDGATAVGAEGSSTSASAMTESLVFTAAQVQHGKVQWSPVVAGGVTSGATLPGELTVDEDRTARLGAAGRGRVIGVRVQPGDNVRQGQVLVILQSPDAGMAQSDVAKATAEVTSRRAGAQYAASARARAERLLALKAIPRQDYERAIADDEQARASLAQANAELARARSTARQLGAGEVSASGELVLRSPLDGVVMERAAQPGTVVEAGAPLVLVTDPSALWLQVKAPEQLSGSFARGRQMAFTVPAYPGERFTARVDAVGAGLDPTTRTLAVRGVVANGSGRLKPAMLATVSIAGPSTSGPVSLPDDAVQLMGGKPTVFVAIPDAKGGARMERRAVELGVRGGGRVTILSGLRVGEIVVTAGAFAVKSQFEKGSMPDMEM